jgi:hypothetical protein
MEELMPQDEVTRKTLTPVPIPGRHHVTVRFGDEIYFDDLIDDHEKRHGPIRRIPYQVSEHDVDDDDFHAYWDSSPAECELFAKMALRIENRLDILRKQM